MACGIKMAGICGVQWVGRQKVSCYQIDYCLHWTIRPKESHCILKTSRSLVQQGGYRKRLFFWIFWSKYFFQVAVTKDRHFMSEDHTRINFILNRENIANITSKKMRNRQQLSCFEWKQFSSVRHMYDMRSTCVTSREKMLSFFTAWHRASFLFHTSLI